MLCHSAHPDPQPLPASLGSRAGQGSPGSHPSCCCGLFPAAQGAQHRAKCTLPATQTPEMCRAVLGKAFPPAFGFPAHRHALEIGTNWRGLGQLGDLGVSLLKRMEQGPAGHGFDHPSHCPGDTSGGHALVFVVRLSPPSCRTGCPCCLLGMSPGLCHP